MSQYNSPYCKQIVVTFDARNAIETDAVNANKFKWASMPDKQRLDSLKVLIYPKVAIIEQASTDNNLPEMIYITWSGISPTIVTAPTAGIGAFNSQPIRWTDVSFAYYFDHVIPPGTVYTNFRIVYKPVDKWTPALAGNNIFDDPRMTVTDSRMFSPGAFVNQLIIPFLSSLVNLQATFAIKAHEPFPVYNQDPVAMGTSVIRSDFLSTPWAPTGSLKKAILGQDEASITPSVKNDFLYYPWNPVGELPRTIELTQDENQIKKQKKELYF